VPATVAGTEGTTRKALSDRPRQHSALLIRNAWGVKKTNALNAPGWFDRKSAVPVFACYHKGPAGSATTYLFVLFELIYMYVCLVGGLNSH
jgi:hypothetical protein